MNAFGWGWPKQLQLSRSASKPRRHNWHILPVIVFLALQTTWLTWSASRESPTLNEPGQLAAGIANWAFLRFEPASVNPPMVRMIAAVPVVLFGCKTNWQGLVFSHSPRCEAQLGMDLASANGTSIQQMTFLGRMMLLPFPIVGGLFCWKWSSELFGYRAGLLSLWIWCVSPSVIGHGQLISNDIPAATMMVGAMFAFWKWWKNPSLMRATLSGLALGAAFATKFSCLVLGPIVVLGYALMLTGSRIKRTRGYSLSTQITAIIINVVTCLVVVNTTYAWQNVFRPIGEFQFVSERLSSLVDQNHFPPFVQSILGRIPVPFAADYVMGLDTQLTDFERPPAESYLNGEWKLGGWWQYYLVGAAVKFPIGFQLLCFVSAVRLSYQLHRRKNIDWHACYLIGIPMLSIWLVVSSQTAFNHHFRYVLPSFGLLVIGASSVGNCQNRIVKFCVFTLGSWVGLSSALAAPHFIAYFNEVFAGNGHKYLLHSNIDFGQDLFELREWSIHRSDDLPLYICYYGFIDPIDYGVRGEIAPFAPIKTHNPKSNRFEPGWYAVSINYAFGCTWGLNSENRYVWLGKRTPTGFCGKSIQLYRIDDPKDLASLNRD